MHNSGVWANEIHALFDIIVIDLVLAGDNAIVIGMAASQVSPDVRKKVIAVGICAAVGLRVMLALLATWLLSIPGLILAGGIMLLFVCWKMFQDIRQAATTTNDGVAFSEIDGSPNSGLLSAAATIVIADLSMSLDNILAVAGAAKGDGQLLAIGLAISIVAMAVASNLLAKLLSKYPWIMWAGLLIILIVAVEMVYEGSSYVACSLSHDKSCVDNSLRGV
ncbi:TerC family protein [Ruegeria arenilitoris]|uniref:TerC family protein n=1 Tax=Ruegeria arenilitoris TaxID=1173585 RepID=UPI001C2C664B